MTHKTLASRRWVLHSKAYLTSSPESVQIEFLFTLLGCRPLCHSCMPSQTSLTLLYKSPTLRKSIPKHYITLVKTSFASIQTSPPGFTSQCYLRLSQISLSGLSIFLQRLLPSVALTDNTLPPLSFMLTLSYQQRAKELARNKVCRLRDRQNEQKLVSWHEWVSIAVTVIQSLQYNWKFDEE